MPVWLALFPDDWVVEPPAELPLPLDEEPQPWAASGALRTAVAKSITVFVTSSDDWRSARLALTALSMAAPTRHRAVEAAP